MHWLNPGVGFDSISKVLAKAWETEPNSMVLAACCLASVGHLDAVQPNRPGGNYTLFKARVLRDVSERMKEGDQVLANDTVIALGLLTSFEMSKGRDGALTHLQGIKGLINLKGGIEFLGCKGLVMMLETLDLIHAILFDMSPVFCTGGSSLGMSPLADTQQSDLRSVSNFTSIIVVEQETFYQSASDRTKYLYLYPTLLSASEYALRDHMAVEESEDIAAHSERSTAYFHDFLAQFQLSTGSLESNGSGLALARVCCLEMIISWNATALRIPYRDRANQDLATQLMNVLRTVKNDDWQSLPYLRLKILLTGASAIKDWQGRSFFKAELIRAIYQMGASEWRRVKIFIARFLAMRRQIDQTTNPD